LPNISPQFTTPHFHSLALHRTRLWALLSLAIALALTDLASAQQEMRYDLLLRGGHVIDPANGLSAVADVAIKRGKVAAVAPNLDPATAVKAIDVSGLYITPGLIDIHVHVYAGTGERRSYAGDNSVYPDGFTFRSGVTTVVDAGCSGWRNFDDFKTKIIDRSKTRVLAFLNIVGNGMRGTRFEQNVDDMEVKPTAEAALRHKGVIVGIKTAHFSGPQFTAVERAVEAGTAARIPVMVDFGRVYPQKSLEELLTKKLRPGDIYTHVYSGLRNELDSTGHANPALLEGRKRGILFDVGHGGGSFFWRVAVPIIGEGFLPDTISTDLHAGNINSGVKDMLGVVNKLMALGVPLDELIRRSTWNPAGAISQPQLGNLSVGSPADIAVLRLEKGDFGLLDSAGARLRADRKLTCEMTLRDGRIVYELNGLSRPEWTALPKSYRTSGHPLWDAAWNYTRNPDDPTVTPTQPAPAPTPPATIPQIDQPKGGRP
jgi:dihydroorotase